MTEDQARPRQMDERTKAMFAELASQRDNFANTCVNLRGELAALRAELAELTKPKPAKAKK